MTAAAFAVAFVGLAGMWLMVKVRRTRIRLRRQLSSPDRETRRAAIFAVSDVQDHASLFLAYARQESDVELLRLLAAQVHSSRWLQTLSEPKIALRIWACRADPGSALVGAGSFRQGSGSGTSKALAHRHRPLGVPVGPGVVSVPGGLLQDSGAAPLGAGVISRLRTWWDILSGRSEQAAAVAEWLSSRIVATFMDVGFLGLLGILTAKVAARTTAGVGSPKGYDSLGHIANTDLLIKWFPHELWNYAWYGGMPSYPGSYPPLYLYALAGIHELTGSSVARALTDTTTAMFIIMALSAYGFVRVLSKSPWAAAIAALMMIGTPTLWNDSLVSGEYPRVAAMALGDLAAFFAACLVVKPTKFRFAATAIALAGALDSHELGLIGVGLVLAVVLVTGKCAVERRLLRAASLLLVVSGLCAWYYAPLVLHPKPSYLAADRIGMIYQGTIPWSTLMFAQGGKPPVLTYLCPVMIPAAGAAVLFTIWALKRPRSDRALVPEVTTGRPWRWRRGHLAQSTAAGLACLAVAFAFLCYTYIGHFTRLPLSVAHAPPDLMLAWAVFPLACAAGVMGGGLLTLARSAWAQIGMSLGGLAGTLGTLAVIWTGTAPLGASAWAPLQKVDISTLTAATPPTGETLDYRIAGQGDNVTEGLNAVTDTPQNRGYLGQSVLNIDDQVRMETVLSSPKSTDAERTFMTDWYGIKWIYSGYGSSQYTSYDNDPSQLRQITNLPSIGYKVYEVVNPAPILSAVTSKTALFIGQYEGYSLTLQDLGLAGTDSENLVPVYGGTDLSGYSLAELRQYPAIEMYTFDVPNAGAEAHLLDQYVKAGGRLVIDVAGNEQPANAMANADPPLFPVSQWQSTEVNNVWQFSTGGGELPAGTDLQKFSPPVYNTAYPWLTEVAHAISPSAQVAVTTAGKPLIAEETYGAGQVIESGMNLPYHAAVFKNAYESRLLSALLTGDVSESGAASEPGSSSVSGTSSAIASAPSVTLADDASISPDSASITVPAGASGILFKENDFPDWHASLDGQSVPIFPAGPSMMYVPLPAGTASGESVQFTYQLSPFEWLSTAITVLFAVGILIWLLVPKGVWRATCSTWLRTRSGQWAKVKCRHLELVP